MMKQKAKNLADQSLTEKEKTVVKILLKKNGFIYQADLVKRSSFSKSTVSYLVNNLNRKNILGILSDRKVNMLIINGGFGFVKEI